jgi:3',5'-cyclic AMP phosphodiesterase CpdA
VSEITAPIRIVQVSDCHLSRTHGYFFNNWDVFVGLMRADAPDLIVNTGDVSFNGPDAEDDLAFARQQHDRLPVVWRAVAGNHDVGEAIIASRLAQVVDETRLARWNKHIGPSFWSEDRGSWRLIGLDTALMGSGLPLEGEQMVFFEQALASRGKRPVMAFVHMPPFTDDPDDAAFTTSCIPHGPRKWFLDRCADGGVKVIACGHVHVHRKQSHRGMAVVCAPGTAFVKHDRKPPRGRVMQRSGYLQWVLDGKRVSHTFIEPSMFINNDMSNWPPSTTKLPPRPLLQAAI